VSSDQARHELEEPLSMMTQENYVNINVNGQVDVLAGGHRKSSLVANESPRGQASLLRVVRWVSR